MTFFKFLFGERPKPAPTARVVNPHPPLVVLPDQPRVKLVKRYDYSEGEATHAQATILRLLKDAKTHRIRVKGDNAFTEVYHYWNDSMPGIDLNLYRPPSPIRHSWVIFFPADNAGNRREVLLPLKYSPLCDEAEFADDERRPSTVKKPHATDSVSG